jgi:hypothetical protein
LSYATSRLAVENVPPIGARACSRAPTSRSRAERAFAASCDGSVVEGPPPTAASDRVAEAEVLGDGDSVGLVVGVGVGVVVGVVVGVGVSAGVGSVVGLASLGDGSGVGFWSVGEGSGVGVEVSAGVDDGVPVGVGESVGVGSIVGSARARPPSAEPSAAVVATRAMIPARRLARHEIPFVRREPLVSGRRGGLGADPIFMTLRRGLGSPGRSSTPPATRRRTRPVTG